ncbi:hypothetical protein P5V15_015079 [Pogonomyrmex californicus]
MRWRLKLEEYDYQIVYKSGSANHNADALSRNPQILAVVNSPAEIIDLLSPEEDSEPPSPTQSQFETLGESSEEDQSQSPPSIQHRRREAQN